MKLIKLNEDHYIIVDDSPIREGDWIYLLQGNTPSTKQGEIAKCEFPDANNLGVTWKKITHSNIGHLYQDSILPLSLQEIKELIGEVDVEKNMWYERNVQNPYSSGSLLHTGFNKGFELGYRQALEDNKDRKYTEEDVIYFVNKSRETGLTAEYLMLSKQPQTEWNVEMVDGKLKLT